MLWKDHEPSIFTELEKKQSHFYLGKKEYKCPVFCNFLQKTEL